MNKVNPQASINQHSQRLIDQISYKRIHSPDFAEKPSPMAQLIAKLKGVFQ